MTFNKRNWAAAILLLCLVACNNEDTPVSSSQSQSTTTAAVPEKKSRQACSLLTEADAKSILGDAIQPGMQTATMCQYVSAAEELSKTGENVSLTLHENAGSEYDKYLADTESSTGIKPEPVTGIGQKAAWAKGTLIVKQGDDLLVIMVGKKLDKVRHLETAKTLAQSILSRM